MSCGAQHPNYPKTTCAYGTPCPPGRAHNGKHLRFWVNWWDAYNRPQPPAETRADEQPVMVESRIPRATEEKVKTQDRESGLNQPSLKNKRRTSTQPAKNTSDKPASLFDL